MEEELVVEVGCPLATARRLALLPPCDGVAALPGPEVAGDGEAEGVGPGLGEAELLWVAEDWAEAGLVKSGTTRSARRWERYLFKQVHFKNASFIYFKCNL